MTSSGKYKTAQSLRMALEERLKNIAKESGDALMKIRRHVAFDRFLARIFHEPVRGLVAKGGYSLDLRVNRARTTKDIDFSFKGDLGGFWDGKPDGLHDFLRQKVEIDLNDFFVYDVGKETIDLENAPYGGFRFPVDVQLAGRRFAAFSIDIAAGDIWFEPHEKLPIHDWLDFAGIPGAMVPVISMEQQFAEKLHAYTQLRDYPNSRIKDLVDMLLIIVKNEMSPVKLEEIARATFSRRDDSTYPAPFNNPTENWRERYSILAKECGIEENIDKAVEIVRHYCVTVGIIKT